MPTTARRSNRHGSTTPGHSGLLALGSRGQPGIVGAEAVQEGNIHFAGEHTSVEYQGFTEGAVRSGARAADEVRMQI